jgi:hypothetical protein
MYQVLLSNPELSLALATAAERLQLLDQPLKHVVLPAPAPKPAATSATASVAAVGSMMGAPTAYRPPQGSAAPPPPPVNLPIEVQHALEMLLREYHPPPSPTSSCLSIHTRIYTYTLISVSRTYQVVSSIELQTPPPLPPRSHTCRYPLLGPHFMQHRELHSLEKINIIRQLPSIPEDRLRTLGRWALLYYRFLVQYLRRFEPCIDVAMHARSVTISLSVGPGSFSCSCAASWSRVLSRRLLRRGGSACGRGSVCFVDVSRVKSV